MSRDISTLPPLPADERIRYGKEPSQFFDLWRPKASPTGAAVMIHGGFWRARYDLSHASHMCAALARSGVAVASLEYRRVGEPGGGWPATFQDVVAGFEAATRKFGRAPAVVGHSAGGHLALRLAAKRNDIPGVVALAPVASLKLAYELNLSNGAVVEFLDGTPGEVPVRYDDACPTSHASPVPRTILHGRKDDIVPISLSLAYMEARKNDVGKVSLIDLPSADHFDLIDPESAVWPIVSDSIAMFAKKPNHSSAETKRFTNR